MKYLLPEPYPCRQSTHICPFTIRCNEIDDAADLIADPEAFAIAAKADRKLTVGDGPTYLESPKRYYLDNGGCPFYEGLINAGSTASVLCSAATVQLHDYLQVKFCEGGRQVYCPIYRAEAGIKGDINELSTNRNILTAAVHPQLEVEGEKANEKM